MAIRLSQIHVAVMRPKSGTVPLSCDNILGLTSGENVFLVTINRNISQSIGFATTSTHNFVQRTVTQSFTWTSAVGTDVHEDITQYLGLTVRQIEAASNGLFQVIPGNPPNGNLVFDVTAASATNLFGWNETVNRAYLANNTIGFSQLAFGLFARETVDILGLVDSVNAANSEYERDDTQHCVKQFLTYTLNNGPCVEKTYSPFVGSGDAGGYDEMETTAPTLVKQTLQLLYPFPPLVGGPGNNGNTYFDFKNPTFGDASTLQFTVIDRTTRGGDRIVYGDPKWAKAQLFDFEIRNVKKSVMEAFVAFVNQSLGKDIGLTDWFGNQFAGVILAPESPIQETSRGYYTINLKFQGDVSSF